jgi:hypothetical protein
MGTNSLINIAECLSHASREVVGMTAYNEAAAHESNNPRLPRAQQ